MAGTELRAEGIDLGLRVSGAAALHLDGGDAPSRADDEAHPPAVIALVERE